MGLQKIISGVINIIKNKCPKCHSGHVFEVQNPYNFKKGMKMNKICAVCGQSFEPEPGFYFGGMYVSYGLSVGVGFAFYLFFALVLNIEVLTSIIYTSIILIVLIPVFFRLSRLIWLYLFVKYNSKLKKKENH